jgi:apolipoprotein D and lipocalin family protein
MHDTGNQSGSVSTFTFLFFVVLSLVGCNTENPPTTVEFVDLQRYVGTWYEIAKIPNRFQKQCVRNTTAHYASRTDGRLDVTNRCITEDNILDEASGIARIVDPETNAKLEVSFVNLLGLQLFWGDYWIIALDEDYQTVIVGTPNRKYGWILSRTPSIDDTRMAALKTQLKQQGYNPQQFEISRQGS